LNEDIKLADNRALITSVRNMSPPYKEAVKGLKEVLTLVLDRREQLVSKENFKLAVEGQVWVAIALLEKARNLEKELMTEETARILVMNSSDDMWRACREYFWSLFNHEYCDLLHRAVESQQSERVQYILEVAPHLAWTKGPKGHYPLRCIKREDTGSNPESGSEELSKVNSEIQNKIIHTLIKNKKTFDIQDILSECKGKGSALLSILML
jgi:hypothetical protein